MSHIPGALRRRRVWRARTCTLSFRLLVLCSRNHETRSSRVSRFRALTCRDHRRAETQNLHPDRTRPDLLVLLDTRVAHLLLRPPEHVLLRHHLKPVAVHLLAQVGVRALLQLDERRSGRAVTRVRKASSLRPRRRSPSPPGTPRSSPPPPRCCNDHAVRPNPPAPETLGRCHRPQSLSGPEEVETRFLHVHLGREPTLSSDRALTF